MRIKDLPQLLTDWKNTSSFIGGTEMFLEFLFPFYLITGSNYTLAPFYFPWPWQPIALITRIWSPFLIPQLHYVYTAVRGN